jgi:uncharacterized protein YecE (DUF72 family)
VPVPTRPYAEVKVGCCGFRLARARYFDRFPVVEVQHTFYQPPQVATLERWREEAPQGFEFAVKAWMLITHVGASPTYRRLARSLTDAERAECGSFRPTPVVREAWETTLASAVALGARRVLFQCPASFQPSDENLDNMKRFFAETASGTGLEYLWEPRGGWPDPLVRAVCEDLGLVHVVDPFAARAVTPDRVYYRIHGRRGRPYEHEELEELASKLPARGAAHVMFNNVRMVADATRFQAIIDRRALDRE